MADDNLKLNNLTVFKQSKKASGTSNCLEKNSRTGSRCERDSALLISQINFIKNYLCLFWSNILLKMMIRMQVKDNLIEFDDNWTSSSDANLKALQTKPEGTSLKFTVFQISKLFSKFRINWVKYTTFLLN